MNSNFFLSASLFVIVLIGPIISVSLFRRHISATLTPNRAKEKLGSR